MWITAATCRRVRHQCATANGSGVAVYMPAARATSGPGRQGLCRRYAVTGACRLDAAPILANAADTRGGPRSIDRQILLAWPCMVRRSPIAQSDWHACMAPKRSVMPIVLAACMLPRFSQGGAAQRLVGDGVAAIDDRRTPTLCWRHAASITLAYGMTHSYKRYL